MVGDFGCGEAFIAAEAGDQHTIHSFDHVAIDKRVIACDIAHVPLEDDSLDLAIFCLSLMGSNFTDYIREAHRCLRLDGHAPHLGGRELLRRRQEVRGRARASSAST